MLSQQNTYLALRFQNTLQSADELALAYRLCRCEATEVAAAYRHAAALALRLVDFDPGWRESLHCCQRRAAFYFERSLKRQPGEA